MYLKSTQKNIQKIPQSLSRSWAQLELVRPKKVTKHWNLGDEILLWQSWTKHFPLWGLIVYQKGEVLNTCCLFSYTPHQKKTKKHGTTTKNEGWEDRDSFSKRHFDSRKWFQPTNTPGPWWCWLSFGPKSLQGFGVTVSPEMVIVLNLSLKNGQWTFTISKYAEIGRFPSKKQIYIYVYI